LWDIYTTIKSAAQVQKTNIVTFVTIVYLHESSVILLIDFVFIRRYDDWSYQEKRLKT